MRTIEEIADAALECQDAAIAAGGETAGYRCADIRDAITWVMFDDERDLYQDVLSAVSGK